ncbi:MAG: hypothetical protein R2806_25345 [Saprospiraceae bacterium]
MNSRPIAHLIFAGMKCRQFLALISIIASTELGFAQTKYEQEIRIRKIEVPTKAGDFVDDMQLTRKIKWYKGKPDALKHHSKLKRNTKEKGSA